MFNLDVETTKLVKLRKLLNEANSNYRVGERLEEKNEQGSVTTLKFKTQEELDKAQEILKTI